MYFNVMERQEYTTCLVSAMSSYCVSLAKLGPDAREADLHRLFNQQQGS